MEGSRLFRLASFTGAENTTVPYMRAEPRNSARVFQEGEFCMDITRYYKDPNEKPLDRIKPDGGFTGIFRTMAFIGDSLSSGEFESTNADGSNGYHDMFEYARTDHVAIMH